MIFSSLPIEGRWYIHGEECEPSYGRLFLDSAEGLVLEVKEIKTLSFVELMHKMARDGEGKATIIQGYDANNLPIRLFGCVPANGTSYRVGLSTCSFSVLRAVTGLDKGRWREVIGIKFYFTLDLLDQWVNPSGRIADANGPCIDYDYKSDDADLTIGVTRCYGGVRGVSVSERHWISLTFPTATLVKDAPRDKAWAMSLLVSLLAGRTMKVTGFQFTTTIDDPVTNGCEVHQDYGAVSQSSPSKGIPMRSTFGDVKDGFGDIANIWLNMLKNPDMRQVLKLYGALKHHRLYIGVRFLLVAQALEAYHTACGRFSSTKWLAPEFKKLKKRVGDALMKDDLKMLSGLLAGANNKTFAERLREVCEDAPKQAKIVIPDIRTFVDTVRNNRNAYTHHVGKQSHSKRLNEGALCELSHQAMALLELLFLRDVKAPEKVSNALVRAYTSATVYDLSEE